MPNPVSWRRRALFVATAVMLPLVASAALAQGDVAGPRPWANPALTPDQRADLVVKAMTLDEKLKLVMGYFATDQAYRKYARPKDSLADSAGFVPGVPRLGIPSQWQTDAGVGVATQHTDKPRERTALPSGLATAATWDPHMAFAGGAMIGNEAHLSGFNVQLAGGVNLARDPRNGRNFEYGGEDPLLAGTMVGNEVKGIQSNPVVSTVKHYAFNDQETARNSIDVKIGDQAGRQSDLLAFQIAIETGHPGSVMCSYNRVNGAYACENPYLLDQVLKKDWAYPGFVMSDWGGTHSTIPAANAGLDQESGVPFDVAEYFGGSLREAVLDGHVGEARLDDMDRRILRSMFASGLFDSPAAGDQSASIDYDAHAKITQADAEAAIVLLKNRPGLLPLARSSKLVVIGGHADVGVLSGGGSAQVYPRGGLAAPNEGPANFPGPQVFDPSSPMKGLASRVHGPLTYVDGKDPAAAAEAAAHADVAIVFATQWLAESFDAKTLSLPDDQDALIAAVAKANPRTVVVLETGGPVTMPWLDKVGAVLESWYPGTSGGEAIARVLTGEVNPSGHLPVTFPASEEQLPRPVIEQVPRGNPHPHVDYDVEGAAVGYKWFDLKGQKPLFPFGHGLSYTRFDFGGLHASAQGGTIVAGFHVRNAGGRSGAATPQVYVSPVAGGWEAPKRLGGWRKLNLAPGRGGDAEVVIDPRLLATWDSAAHRWTIAEGDYRVILARDADTPVETVTVRVDARTFGPQGK